MHIAEIYRVRIFASKITKKVINQLLFVYTFSLLTERVIVHFIVRGLYK